tara:strand:+ start:148 stop:411 length:264 start_codon:yes stop_codon:yes gene_type:complete
MINKNFSEEEISRIIEMAWEDRTPFEAIEKEYELTNAEVIKLMRKHMKRSSFEMWRKRTQGRKTKHQKLFPREYYRFVSPNQGKVRK